MKKNFPLVLVLIFAFLLRFIGTNPGYNQYHSDEGITYSAAVSMIKNGNLDPLRYDYPALVPLVNYFFFKFIFIPLNWTFFYLSNISKIIDGLIHIPIAPLEKAKIFQISILGEREINALFWGRYVTALFSLANVYLVYWLGKKLFGKNVGLLGALFLAVSFKAVVNSHIGLPDTYNAFFLLLSLIFSYRIIDKPTFRNYLLAGLFIGLSFSTKYQVFAVFPFLIAHFFASRLNLKNVFSWKIVLSGLMAVGIFILLNPYLWLNYQSAFEIISYVSKKYAMGRNSLMAYPFFYLLHFDYGLPLFMLSIVGICYSLKKFTKQALFLLTGIISFFYVMVFYSNGGFYIRNFITITPLVMLFAALALYSLKFLLNKWFFTVLVIGSTIIPLKNALINSYNYTKTWSYKEILNKAEKVLPENSQVASHPFDPLPGDIVRSPFKGESCYSLAEFREDGSEFALINMDWAGNYFYSWMTASFPAAGKYLFNKPIAQMRNTFWGISIEEMMNFILSSSFKPWQAADAALFLVKVPFFNDIIEYNPFFNLDLFDWVVVPSEFRGSLLLKEKLSKNGKTELEIGPGSIGNGVARFVSEEIDIKPVFVYRITGVVESAEPVLKNKRSVFIRVDFFDQNSLLEERGVSVSVSPRYFGEGDKELEILAIAPAEAKTARISLQPSENLYHSFWLKSVRIEESKRKVDLKENYEKVEFKQYKDLLYQNSHGNL
ncbi:MAG: glycosyltransferase family 39 protein [bacterium]